MLLDAVAADSGFSPWENTGTGSQSAHDEEWTVLVPFFNERAYLAATIASLAAQDRPARLVLIDNGSTDDSAAVASAACQRLGLAYTLIEERRPGKVSALAAGLNRVRTRYVATCDADTWYPSDYLSQATRLLAIDGSGAAGAYFVRDGADEQDHRAAARHILSAARLLPRQCHTGGAGQVFRTASLRRAGGFDALRWNWVLEDHEIIHRVSTVGSIEYGDRFWCVPAMRDRDRASIRWTLAERLLYHATPFPLRDWFFYRFLASRLRARRLTSERIRERQFHDIGALSDAAPYSVCG
jgi:glycosyltransferase involved in cell wall biosynthesis